MRKVNCYGNIITKFEESNKSIEEIGLKHGDFISVRLLFKILKILKIIELFIDCSKQAFS